MSIIVAYVFFSILESSAQATLQNWKLGGAFAGFVFTASLLTSITFQVYKHMTTDRIDTFREQIQELQSKLIRGAPRPQGYVIDIDERHKLVFSRPEKWLPKEGLLYQYISNKKLEFKANFNVIYTSETDLCDLFDQLKLGKFDSVNVDLEKLYDIFAQGNIRGLEPFQAENVSETKEFILVDDIKSLKQIISYTLPNPIGTDIKNLCAAAIYSYVPRLKALYQFTFSDSKENFLESSEVFNNVIRSIRFL